MTPEATQPDLFNPEASTIEADLSGDDFLALCADTNWRIVWIERRGNAGWRVKAQRVTTQPEAAPMPEARLPYRDD
jgi:hypothetical protein